MIIAQAECFLTDWTLNDTKKLLSTTANSLVIFEAAKLSMRGGKAEIVDNCSTDKSF